MAIKFYQSYNVDLNAFKEFTCCLCERGGTEVDIYNFCVDCDKYFCATCLQHHTTPVKKGQYKMKLRKRGMQYLDNTRFPFRTATADVTIQNDIFCDSHNLMFCESCTPMDIRSNTNIGYIPEDDLTVIKSQEHKEIQEGLSKMHIELQLVKKKKENELLSFMKNKNSNLKEIQDFRKTVVKLLDDFEDHVKEQIEIMENGFEETTRRHINSLQGMISRMDISLKQLESYHDEDHKLLEFMNNCRQNETDAKKLVCEMQSPAASERKAESLKHTINQGVEEFTYKVNKLGNSVSNHSETIHFQGQYNVKAKADRSNCDINGSCFLDDGTLLLTDWNNTKLKRLSNDYQVRDYLDMAGVPWAVCPTVSSEVAVSLYLLRKIQFVDVGKKLTPTWSFKVGEVCRGVTFSRNELFVSCGGAGLGEGQGHIRVYNTSGHLLTTLLHDTTLHKPLFSCPNNITVSEDETTLFIADRDNGIVKVDRNGDGRLEFTDPELTEAKGICKGDNDDLFVCGSKSDRVIHLDNIRTRLGVIECSINGIGNPQSLAYHSNNGQLIVTTGNSDIIQVFHISQVLQIAHL